MQIPQLSLVEKAGRYWLSEDLKKGICPLLADFTSVILAEPVTPVSMASISEG